MRDALDWCESLALALVALGLLYLLGGCAPSAPATSPSGCSAAALETLTSACEVSILEAPADQVDTVAEACLQSVATWKVLCGEATP